MGSGARHIEIPPGGQVLQTPLCFFDMTAQADWAERILSCKDDENLTQILSDQEERYDDQGDARRSFSAIGMPG
jgi:hypothetical protein